MLLAIAGFVFAYQFVDPAPPSHFTIATGGEGGAYYRYAQQYKALLAKHGVTVDVKATNGSVENLQLLRAQDAGVPVAFVQGGAGLPVPNDPLFSLASLYFEPLWVFHQQSLTVRELSDLRGRTIAVGTLGSGTRAVALRLLNDNGVNESNSVLSPLSPPRAADALLALEVDAVVLVSSPSAEVIDQLLRADKIEVMDFVRADAYTRTYRFLSKAVLPEGVVNLADNVPARAVRLLAPAAALVVRDDFHPALVDLLMAAASEVHREGGVFEEREQFPSTHYLQFPLSDEARRYFESGPSFLRRLLPFWAASLVERMLVMLLPLLALLIPLMKIMPPMYRWQIRSRIYRWYKELLFIDPTVHGDLEADRLQQGLKELARIEEEVGKVNVPLSYADQLYALRLHMELVREKLNAVLNRDSPDVPKGADKAAKKGVDNDSDSGHSSEWNTNDGGGTVHS
jgi:TRAP transporter TAXI family solute receptor